LYQRVRKIRTDSFVGIGANLDPKWSDTCARLLLASKHRQLSSLLTHVQYDEIDRCSIVLFCDEKVLAYVISPVVLRESATFVHDKWIISERDTHLTMLHEQQAYVLDSPSPPQDAPLEGLFGLVPDDVETHPDPRAIRTASASALADSIEVVDWDPK
jgi:hypothetical protein